METQQVTLHRYFICADLMRADFERSVRADRDPLDAVGDGFKYLVTPSGTYMSLWYATLYVVVEGWCELGLHDEGVEGFLQSPNLALLKRYRHGVCHFQESWLDPRLEQFFASQDSVAWVRGLHEAFRSSFHAMYASSGHGA